MRPDKELEPPSGVDGLEAPYAVPRADQTHLVQSCGRVTANDRREQEGESKEKARARCDHHPYSLQREFSSLSCALRSSPRGPTKLPSGKKFCPPGSYETRGPHCAFPERSAQYNTRTRIVSGMDCNSRARPMPSESLPKESLVLEEVKEFVHGASYGIGLGDDRLPMTILGEGHEAVDQSKGPKF